MLTGVILAGGQNRRMGGRHKGLLPFAKESFIERQIRVMRHVCQEIILVTNRSELFHPLVGDTIRVIADELPGKGPLSGMQAAFKTARYEDIWVVGCDMPFISTQAADVLRARKQECDCDAVVPFIANDIHPLHGIYDRGGLPIMNQLLERKQYPLKSYIESVNSELVPESVFLAQGLDLRFVCNVNTPEEYKLAIEGRANVRK